MGRAFIARWARMRHSIALLSASASSHHDLSLAGFITNIAESEFSAHTGLDSRRKNHASLHDLCSAAFTINIAGFEFSERKGKSEIRQ